MGCLFVVLRFGEYKPKFIFKLMFYLMFIHIKVYTNSVLEKGKDDASNGTQTTSSVCVAVDHL